MFKRRLGVLVLCTGNSCRSQMAQAFLEHHGGGDFPVYSAGTEPADRVHPLAVRVMAEKGIDISDRRPKGVREYLGRVPVHTLIIVCDGAAKSCPSVWPGVMERLHWPFEDPAVAEGGEEERLTVFRRVRDEIEERVRGWLAEQSEAV